VQILFLGATVINGSLCAPALTIIINPTYTLSFPVSLPPLLTLSKGPPIEAAIGITLGSLVVVSALWLLNWRQAQRVERPSFGTETSEEDLLHIQS
jgi:hypothetical protein